MERKGNLLSTQNEIEIEVLGHAVVVRTASYQPQNSRTHLPYFSNWGYNGGAPVQTDPTGSRLSLSLDHRGFYVEYMSVDGYLHRSGRAFKVGEVDDT